MINVLNKRDHFSKQWLLQKAFLLFSQPFQLLHCEICFVFFNFFNFLKKAFGNPLAWKLQHK